MARRTVSHVVEVSIKFTGRFRGVNGKRKVDDW